MESEDVDIVVAHHSHFLPFRERFHRVDRVSVMRGKFVLLGGRTFFHLHLHPFDQVVVSALEKKLHVFDGFLLVLEGCETFDTGPKASVNVVLQTRSWTFPIDLNVAVADEEITFDQLQGFARPTRWKEWNEVCSAV